MSPAADPTEAIRERAETLPAVSVGTSCNQTSFKTRTGSFLFIGPGAKGQGFKAMFRLRDSLPEAQRLASSRPDNFEVGSTGWVTARFTVDAPLLKSIWQKWLMESYNLANGKVGQGAPRRKKK